MMMEGRFQDIVQWRKFKEFKELILGECHCSDTQQHLIRKNQKTMFGRRFKMFGRLHPKSYADRLYVPRNEDEV